MKKSLGAQTFALPTPAWVIGTYDEAGKPNIMTAAWGAICASTPPCVTVSLQKPRASYQNIIKHQAFTVNIPSATYAAEVDYAGIVSGKLVDKFAVTGLTPVRSQLVDAPYVSEFPLILECRLINTLEVGSHTLFIGEIADVKAEERVLDDQGALVVDKVNPLSYSPPDRAYYELGENVGKAFSIGMQFKK
ncbi:MAG TPA: flavin reductase family protein [Patescibacteria group bacterium]|nr:flavin reductase family protein [Patescibacteria group bacterium]